MDPQPFPRRFQGDNQVNDPIYLQSWGDKIETSDPPHENLPKRESCVASSNYFSHFLNGNGFGNRKWYQRMKQESGDGTVFAYLVPEGGGFQEPELRRSILDSRCNV
jgi:hypothetical protein